MEYKVSSFIGSGYKNFDLKFIFDNLRNVGICAAVMAVGATYMTHPGAKLLNIFEFDNSLIGLAIIVVGGLLLVVNYVQFIYVANSKTGKKAVWVSAIISLPVYLFTAHLAVGYVFNWS